MSYIPNEYIKNETKCITMTKIGDHVFVILFDWYKSSTFKHCTLKTFEDKDHLVSFITAYSALAQRLTHDRLF